MCPQCSTDYAVVLHSRPQPIATFQWINEAKQPPYHQEVCKTMIWDYWLCWLWGLMIVSDWGGSGWIMLQTTSIVMIEHISGLFSMIVGDHTEQYYHCSDWAYIWFIQYDCGWSYWAFIPSLWLRLVSGLSSMIVGDHTEHSYHRSDWG